MFSFDKHNDRIMVSVIMCVCPQTKECMFGTNNAQLCVSLLDEKQAPKMYLYKIITKLMPVGTDFDRLDLIANY